MNPLRNRRKVALQVLYQLDNGVFTDDEASQLEAIRESLESNSSCEDTIAEGVKIAKEAWEHREAADAALAPLTPDWPMHRQPVIDRNLLRLGWYEMFQLGTPPKVVISEAVELAREFSTDQSPSFINGVLDHLFKQLRDTQPASPDSLAPDTPA